MKKVYLILLAIIILIGGYFVIKHKTPKTDNIPASWLTYTKSWIQFRYPGSFWANVRHAFTRPPVITVVPKKQDPFVAWCDMSDITLVQTGNNKTASGLKYLSYKLQDAGAWSLYSNYCYILQGTINYYVMRFTIQSHTGCENGQCWAYCDTKFEQECRNFDLTRDVESSIKKIVDSAKEIISP